MKMASSFKFLSSIVEAIPVASVIGVMGYTLWKSVEQTFLAEDQSKKKAYNGNLDGQFDSSTQQAVDKITDKFLFKISPQQMALVHFYWSNQPLIHHIGTTKARYGTYIGIPVHYKYQVPSEVNLSILQLETSSSAVDRTLLQNLQDALVLSENAKKFAIASELHLANSVEFFMKSDPVFMTFGAIATGKVFFQKRIYSMSVVGKFSAFVCVALLWTAMHFLVAGLYTITLQGRSDRKAADMGEDFLVGGIEYLNKLEQKNKALRELYGNTGKSLFNEKGDVIQQGLEVRTMPVSERKRCLLDYEEQMKAKQSEATS